MAEHRAEAERALETFADKHEAKNEKAVTCLTKDREALLALYDFAAEHWQHVRTANPTHRAALQLGVQKRASSR